MVPGRQPACGTDWDNALAEVPSELGVAGTLNGREFALPLQELHVEFDCTGPGQPPPIHFGFTLDGVAFVIRRCDGIAYLPDNTGIALETDVTATSATVNVDSERPSGGRFRLTGRQSSDSEPLELEFSLAVPLQVSKPRGICPG